MPTNRKTVTERDFRKPEFLDADPADYEFRPDGAIVRKDRWETAFHEIRDLIGVDARSFEISEVVERVRQLVPDPDGWVLLPDLPSDGDVVGVELFCGSVLAKARYTDNRFMWHGTDVSGLVSCWKKHTAA